MSELAYETATVIRAGFVTYHTQFKSLTRRARRCFERRDWRRNQQNARERLDLYSEMVDRALSDVKRLLEDSVSNKPLWMEMKHAYAHLVADRPDSEVAETFFNSISRRVFITVGVDPRVEFITSDVMPVPLPGDETPFVCRSYSLLHHDSPAQLFGTLLSDCQLTTGFSDLQEDAEEVAARALAALPGLTRVDLVRSIFYRGKAAYLIGRLVGPDGKLPLVLALRNGDGGVAIDAVLTSEDEISIIFSFAHAYFHVETERPAELVGFLKALMPRKPVSDIWISIGYNRHGKTVQYRELLHHLATSSDRFEIARGARGMVMIVFTLPGFEMVFKMIKDQFDYPKTSTRQDVMERYRLVFRHDRAGRLIDAQSFEYLEFDRNRFQPALLEELLNVAAESVQLVGNKVVLKFLYLERRVTPLNLYLAEVDAEKARAAAIEYGQAIKDLAATNIFPGDLFLKNFGVTRHGRVLFYDYDELCFVTDCHFRRIPPPRSWEDELSGEPWYTVREHDVFPEQFVHFLGLRPDLKRHFLQMHGDLLEPEYWQTIQRYHQAGLLPDIYPYRPERRLHMPPADSQSISPQSYVVSAAR